MDFEYNEIERMFTQDIIDKRRAGSGAFHRTGKGVKHGMRGIRFPSDSLTAAQKKKLNGEMVVVSGLGVKLTKEEFLANTEEKQKQILEHWRKLYSSKEIQEFLDIDKNFYYKLLYDLGILEKPVSYGKSTSKPAQVKMKPINLTGSNAETDSKRRGRQASSLPDAKVENVVAYEEFKLLDPIKRMAYIEEVTQKYNSRSIADVWGMRLNNFYNVKHQLKLRIEKLQQQEESTHENQNIQNQHTDVEQNVHQLDMEEINAQPHVIETQAPVVIQNETPQSTVTPNASENTMSEIDMLKDMIQQQNQLIQGIMSMQQEVAATTPAPVAHVEIPTPEVTVVEKKRNNMEFTFVDENEGFILHQDIKRFITVLEKNPDLFEVEIKIRRK